MNSNDDRLIGAYFDGTLSPEQKGALQGLLTQSAEARKRFRLLATIEDGLAERGQESASIETNVSPAALPPKQPGRGPMWRALVSTAAGIVIGALTTTLLWAHAVPKVSRIDVPLVDPGFEEVITPVPAVIPRGLNRWNGDASHTVSSGDSGVKPKQGRFMLKMLPVEDRRYSRIEQIVDVSHLVPAEGGAVTFSASTICDGAVNQSKMILVLRAFTLASAEISGSTEKLDDQVTSEARKRVLIPAGSTDWHTGSVRMDLPANTKTLVFAIAAIDLPKPSKGSSRYIDDIKATIVVTHPDENQQ
jgi:hypothetical protein